MDVWLWEGGRSFFGTHRVSVALDSKSAHNWGVHWDGSFWTHSSCFYFVHLISWVINIPNHNEDVRFLSVLETFYTDLTPFKALLGLPLSIACGHMGAQAGRSEQEQESLTNNKKKKGKLEEFEKKLMEIW